MNIILSKDIPSFSALLIVVDSAVSSALNIPQVFSYEPKQMIHTILIPMIRQWAPSAPIYIGFKKQTTPVHCSANCSPYLLLVQNTVLFTLTQPFLWLVTLEILESFPSQPMILHNVNTV